MDKAILKGRVQIATKEMYLESKMINSELVISIHIPVKYETDLS